MLRELLHYGIHFLLPVLVGMIAYPGNRLKATGILLAGILIDLDHLWATPVFDPMRCSIGFHVALLCCQVQCHVQCLTGGV